MPATLFLLGCVLAPAQASSPSAPGTLPAAGPREWALPLYLDQAQELLYHGSYVEESLSGGVQFNRAYRLETRMLVLASSPRGATVAVMTQVKARDARASQEAARGAIRLEKVMVASNGRLVAEAGHTLEVPLDGPPTCECGMIPELPSGRVAQGEGWEISERNRPPRLWRAAGMEMANGTSCVKLVASQQSSDWDEPRLNRIAWRRDDTVWVAPRTGLAVRVQRVVARREVGRREPSYRGTLRYELESNLRYSGRLFEERRQEVMQSWALAEAVLPFFAEPAQNGPQLNAVLARINRVLERLNPTPYREALLYLKGQVEAALRGETILPVSAPAPSSTSADVGQPAPDFVASNITHSGPSFQLQRRLGRPIVLVFYQPQSPTSAAVLGFAQQLATEYGARAVVLGMAVAGQPEHIRKEWSELKLTFPILSGGGLRNSYAIDSTPKIVVLDAGGIVAGTYLGWGTDTAQEVRAELRRTLTRK